jgi:hypothetical protein
MSNNTNAFNTLYNALEAFVNNDNFEYKMDDGMIVHPGEPLFALALNAKRELQSGGLIPEPNKNNQALAEQLSELSNNNLLSDSVRNVLSQAAKVLEC